MANKIYDFIPAHLRNRNLEDIFDTTLERVFSKGSVDKTRAFVGRREKGLNENDDRYLSFPKHLYQRDNYGLEPVFQNSNLKHRVYYDDLLNSMYNRGMLINDHRRLFESDRQTINLPVDADKFVNWQMYYWVKPLVLYKHSFDSNGFAQYEDDGTTPKVVLVKSGNEQVYVNHPGIVMTSNAKSEYITIDDGADNYWSKINSWYHHEDIRSIMSNEPGVTKISDITQRTTTHEVTNGQNDFYYVKSDNTHLFIQAKRPIIEFDKQLEIFQDVTEWKVPEFRLYDVDGNRLEDGFTIFEYVQDDLFTPDPLLGIDVKVKSGDFNSEFVYQIAMPEESSYKLGETLTPLYIETQFNYRNIRREIGISESLVSIDLPQEPITTTDVDVYVDGIKQNGNYTIEGTQVNFNKPVNGDVYVDLCTLAPVDLDGDTTWQRVDPILEYNIDNENHNYVEFTYSVFFEHFTRQIETTEGLTGIATELNNYRTLQAGSKVKFNNKGSVIVKHSTDAKKGYFSLTREDYDPISALQFLGNSYASYKNKFILKVQELLKSDLYDSKSDLEVFETVIKEIATVKRENIDIFTGSKMILLGELYNHYIEGRLTLTLGGYEHFVPVEMMNTIIEPENVMIVLNDRIMQYNEEYIVSSSGNQIIFTDYEVQPTGTLEIADTRVSSTRIRTALA